MNWRKKLKPYDKKKEEKLKMEIEVAGGLDKKDLPSMIFSALITIVPVCVLVLGFICLSVLLIFGAL